MPAPKTVLLAPKTAALAPRMTAAPHILIRAAQTKTSKIVYAALTYTAALINGINNAYSRPKLNADCNVNKTAYRTAMKRSAAPTVVAGRAAVALQEMSVSQIHALAHPLSVTLCPRRAVASKIAL